MVRLSTVVFTVVSLCLKEPLAMLVRRHFVCHVHCLVHDGAVHSSPCGPHHENFGQNLYHMFVPAYSASQILCFVLCGIRVASKSSVDSIPFKRCSHISMGVLILVIIEIVMSILSDRCASIQVDLIISTFVRSILSFLNGVCFIRPQVAFVFPPSTLFFKDSDFLIKYHFY